MILLIVKNVINHAKMAVQNLDQKVIHNLISWTIESFILSIVYIKYKKQF